MAATGNRRKAGPPASLDLAMAVALGLTLCGAPQATSAPLCVTPLSNHGVRSGYVGHYLTRLTRAFFSRGSVQDSATYVVHNRQSFCIGRLDIYSNVQDTVKAVKVTDRNDAIANIDEVQIYVDSNGNGLWDSGDAMVASNFAGLAFTGPPATDSIATFTSFSQVLTVPANSHWKSNAAGSWPRATGPGDSLAQSDPRLILFIVYKMAQQVANGSALRTAFQAGGSGLVLSSVFQDSTNFANGIFNSGIGAWLNAAMENDSTAVTPGGIRYSAAAYTATQDRMRPWAQASHYWSPSLFALGQPAVNRASQNDTNVPILLFGLQAPDSGFASRKSPGPAGGLRVFGRGDTTRVTAGLGWFKGNQFDSLVSVAVTGENTNDIDVKTVKLWLKGPSSTADTLESSDTLLAAVGGQAGYSAFTSGKATLMIGSGAGVGPVRANGNSRFSYNQARNFLVTYDINPVDRTHNGDVLDLKLAQFDIRNSVTGYTPPVTLAVDSAVMKFFYGDTCLGVATLLFLPRSSTYSDPTVPPGPVFFDSVGVSVHRDPGDWFFLSGQCDSIAPWIVADAAYVNGFGPVPGYSGLTGHGLPLGVPLDSILVPTSPLYVTDHIPLGTSTVKVKLADTNRGICGNSALYLIKVAAGSVAAPGRESGTGSLALRVAGSNPFLQTSRVTYVLPARGHANLSLYSVAGREVRKLLDGEFEAGTGTIDIDGRGLPAGVYFLRLQACGKEVGQRIVLLR
ncbi:MAG TPA: T9SS type A sorting domain-containing protein [Candidatus Saccharimonadales bacterium]|nr:T9SS type A sorting domain-containing protein [Candidatus Saccharimonadales bacterium]